MLRETLLPILLPVNRPGKLSGPVVTRSFEKQAPRNQSNRQNLHDDLAKVKPVSLSVIKSVKTNLVFLTKPGEQFIHASFIKKFFFPSEKKFCTC